MAEAPNQDHYDAVEDKLGKDIICLRCFATLYSYTDVCTAALDDPCPGYEAIQGALDEAMSPRPPSSPL